MMVKVTLVFLLGMALVAMVGRALFPGVLRRVARRGAAPRKPGLCPSCGRHLIGTGPCACGAVRRKG